MFYVTPSIEVINFFSPEKENVPPECHIENSGTINIENQEASTSTSEATVGKWSRRAILHLIENYKNNFPRMCGTSVKNAIVWRDITEALNSEGFKYTKKQVENKFKYLKQKYIKKRDNMGDKHTGASPVEFDYFNEFDEIFGEKPSVEPSAIASSSHQETFENEEEHPRKKLKISKKEKEVSMILQDFREREKCRQEDRERRHKERQEIAERAITSFEKMMNKLIEKM